MNENEACSKFGSGDYRSCQFKYNHEYHQTLVYKVMCARKPDNVYVTFEEVLDMIRRVYHMSLGLKQIVYLIGWQYDGHDSRYPAWFEVNRRLKRRQDGDAAESLIWLMNEARQYNAVVSLHINMCDAYENSPLWSEYLEKDLLIKNEDGSLLPGGFWDGDQSYLVSKALEWRSGHARDRIDKLLELLPPLKDAGTIHIDVFHPRPSPFHGITFEDDVQALTEVLQYWKSKGLDVTKEWFHHEFAGMVPMAYHLNLDEASRLRYPPSVICGGGQCWNMRHAKSYLDAPWAGFFKAPDAGCLYENAWGYSVDEDFEKDLGQFLQGFYTKTLPWYFLNRHAIKSHIHTPDTYQVVFDDGIVSSVRKQDGYYSLMQGEYVLVDGTDVCMPAMWKKNGTYIAYSLKGCSQEWLLPGDWSGVSEAGFRILTCGEEDKGKTISVVDQKVRLELEPGQAAELKPVLKQA